jgi:uncharacterized protein (DUF952 family)
MVYHMLPKTIWQMQIGQSHYQSVTLEQEGFIHCTAEPALLLHVANRFYRAEPGEWLILCIDEKRVAADVRWESADGALFPHIYGLLNLDAVVDCIGFPRSDAGEFMAPPGWTQSKTGSSNQSVI